MTMLVSRPLLYVIACAAPPARDLPAILPELEQRGWELRVIATPSATSFLTAGDVARFRVLTRQREPDDPKPRPASALIAAPVTFNTLNKWSAGIADNLVLGTLAETIWDPAVPVVIVPWVNDALARNPAYGNSIAKLGRTKATIVKGPSQDTRGPNRASLHVPEFPWTNAIAALPRV